MITSNINIKYKGVEVKDVAEKIGGMVLGEKGAMIGKVIDNLTKDVTIDLDDMKINKDKKWKETIKY